MDEAIPLIFDLDERGDLGRRLARRTDGELADHELRRFGDDELKIRPLETVRNRDVYVVQPLYGDPEWSVHDRLCRLVFFLGALRDAGARTVTPVLPYLCYARKDRRTKPRDPLTLKYVIGMIESAQVDRLLTVDVHNLSAFENAARCRTVHLEAAPRFAEALSERLEPSDRPVVLSPDLGGTKRAERFRAVLSRVLDEQIDSAFLEKHRSSGDVTGGTLVGPVRDRTVLIYDDMISSGGTMRRALDAAREAGARRAFAAAPHGLLVEDAPDTLEHPLLEELLVADTHPVFRLGEYPLAERVSVLPLAPLIAEAVERLQAGRSLADLTHPDERG